MRLLIDMNLAPRWGFVLITKDLDFAGILAHYLSTKAKVSSCCVVSPLIPEVRGEALIGAIADCSAELESGAILTIDWLDRPRARLLPLT